VQFGNRSDETEAKAASRGSSGCVAAKERLEEFRQIFLTDAGSVIGDDQFHSGRPKRPIDLNTNAGRSMGERVVEAIRDHLREEFPVAL
jgi:hypothetical protein